MEDGDIAFVFDLDGTLVNSTEIGFKIQQKLMAKYSIEVTPALQDELEEILEVRLQGKLSVISAIKIIMTMLKRVGLSFFQRIGALLYAGKLYKEERGKVDFYDGTFELFEYLEEERIKHVIVTGSSLKEVRNYFKNQPEKFDKIKNLLVTRDQVKRIKPHPEGMEIAAKMLSIDPKNIAVIGDMHFDIEMGKNIGSVTVGVLTGYFTKEKLEGYGPDLILDSIIDIPENIEKIRKKIRLNS